MKRVAQRKKSQNANVVFGFSHYEQMIAAGAVEDEPAMVGTNEAVIAVNS